MSESKCRLRSSAEAAKCDAMRVTVELRDLCRVILTPEGEEALTSYIRSCPLGKDPFETGLTTPDGARVLIASFWEIMHVFGSYVVSSHGKLFRGGKIIFATGE